MHAVILAAGKGTRLRPLTDTTPKGLVDIGNGVPLLEATLAALPEEIDRVLIVIGHLGEKIRAHFGDAWRGIPLSYVTQEPLNGTGTAVALAKGSVSGPFLVVNGDDVYAKADLSRLIVHPLAVLVQTTDERLPHSALVSADGRFLGIEGAPANGQPSRRVCGAYVLDERFFKYPPVVIDVRGQAEFSLPHTLVELGKDAVVRAEEAAYWRPVGTPAELARIRAEA